MRAYSIDLRQRIVDAVGAGRPQREAARTFGVAVSTVKHYLQQYERTGSLARKPMPGCPRHVGLEHEVALLAQVQAHPTATLAEHCAWWEQAHGRVVRVATMSRAIHRLGMTRKKGQW